MREGKGTKGLDTFVVRWVEPANDGIVQVWKESRHDVHRCRGCCLGHLNYKALYTCRLPAAHQELTDAIAVHPFPVITSQGGAG